MINKWRSWLPVGTVIVLCGLIPAVGASAPETKPDTIAIVVRHAERADDESADPPLSDAGMERAKALAHVLANVDIKAVFVSQYGRTRQTAEPTAKAHGVSITEVDARKTDAVVERVLAEHRGETVLIVGHSNTVPDIIAGLGGGKMAALPEGDFDDLFLVYVPGKGPTRVVALQYGASD